MPQQYLTEMFTQESVNLVQAAISLPLAFALGYFISWVYRRTYRGFSYNAGFNVTLIMITLIVTVIMMSISSNIALSLGLIGSLSIIRFRTVVKDATDICYIFWGIATGLTLGAHLFVLAIGTTIFLAIVVTILSRFLFKRLQGNDFVVIAQFEPGSPAASHSVTAIFDEQRLPWKIRSSEIDNDSQTKEIVYQVNERTAADCCSDLLDRLQQITGVRKVSLLSSEVNVFV